MAIVLTSKDPRLRKVLIVDDEQTMISTLRELLTLWGFLVTTADSPDKALEVMQQETFAVVMSDHEMPGMTGLSLLAKMKELHPTTTRILITGRVRAREVADAHDTGVIYRYIPKPFSLEELAITLRNATERFQLMTENAVLQAQAIAAKCAARAAAPAPEKIVGDEVPIQSPEEEMAPPVPSPYDTETVIGSQEVTPEQAELAIHGLVKMLYTFHPNLGSASLRATALCRTIGEILQLPPDELKDFLWAAALHDIAMVGIDRAIARRWLRGPEKCAEDELKIIKQHPEQSAEMLRYSPIFENAGEIIRAHHENMDGTGYPLGLKEEMIPWLSRVLAVVVYCCNSHTPGTERITEAEAQVGTVFDADAVELVAKALPLTRMPMGEREILMTEMKARMVLARGINNAHGLLLFPKGRELTDATINKIWSIDRTTPLDQIVLVYA
jgi:response regulator RpfG family c-di-GMP phosphodiesterase